MANRLIQTFDFAVDRAVRKWPGIALTVSCEMEFVFDEDATPLEVMCANIDDELASHLDLIDYHRHSDPEIPFALLDWEAGELWMKLADGTTAYRQSHSAVLSVRYLDGGAALQISLFLDDSII